MVTVRSEDPLTFFFSTDIFVQEGSSGTHFDRGQFEIKTFPIYVLTLSRAKAFSPEMKICKSADHPIYFKENL